RVSLTLARTFQLLEDEEPARALFNAGAAIVEAKAESIRSESMRRRYLGSRDAEMIRAEAGAP
ncbi:MAG TPA: hypothetical protein RMH26_28555, partial [Polyangiaceae bacterium LLY-WYZ-15_(1-7)]|nr:hypothetical protein [Polyangiaceae bacterium LLY-WYZ-15_(1-7)]